MTHAIKLYYSVTFMANIIPTTLHILFNSLVFWNWCLYKLSDYTAKTV